MEISRVISKMLIHYHATCVDITNCLGQLHLISDDEWEERNKKHVMALFNNPQINKGLTAKHKKEEDP